MKDKGLLVLIVTMLVAFYIHHNYLSSKKGLRIVAEYSEAEVLKALVVDSRDSVFLTAVAKAQDLKRTTPSYGFYSLFCQEYELLDHSVPAASLFVTGEPDCPFRRSMSNVDLSSTLDSLEISLLWSMADALSSRFSAMGVSSPAVSPDFDSNRLVIDLPGFTDIDRAKSAIQLCANIQFFNTYDNSDVFPYLEALDFYSRNIPMSLVEASYDDTLAYARLYDFMAAQDSVGVEHFFWHF